MSLAKQEKTYRVSVHGMLEQSTANATCLTYLKGCEIVCELPYNGLILYGAHFSIADKTQVEHKPVSVVFSAVDSHRITDYLHFTHVPVSGAQNKNSIPVVK